MARARITPGFQVSVDRQVRIIPNPRPSQGSLIGFDLHIRKFLIIINDDGDSVEDVEGEFQMQLFLPESEFGSCTQRILVDLLLRQAGSPSSQQGGLETMLDSAFSEAKLILQEEKEKKMQIMNANGPEFFSNIPVLALRIEKFMRWETEVPILCATAESILSLPKVKLIELEDEDQESVECTICLDQLSPGTEVTCMPCLHLFHEDCIYKWLNTSHKCPLCRFPMPTNASS